MKRGPYLAWALGTSIGAAAGVMLGPFRIGWGLAVAFPAIALRNVKVAVDQARQVGRHQAAGVLGVGVAIGHALKRLAERRQLRR